MKVVTNGSIDYKEIEAAIQKVFGDKIDESHGHEHPGAPRRWRSATFWDEDGGDDGGEDDATWVKTFFERHQIEVAMSPMQ